MPKGLYADNYVVVFDGIIMEFSAIKGWIEMGAVSYDDLRHATYDEAWRYSNLKLGK